MKDPHAALTQMGKNLPKHAKIHVHEETGDSIHIVLHKAPLNAQNMSESELKKVAAAQCRVCQLYSRLNFILQFLAA